MSDSSTSQRLSNIESVLAEALATNVEVLNAVKSVAIFLTFVYENSESAENDRELEGLISTLKQRVTSLRQIEQRCWLLRERIRG